MPRLVGPLFSASASGVFADLIEYRKQGGKAVAAKVRTNTKPRTAAQQLRAVRFKEGATAWSALAWTQQNQWKSASADHGMNGYQLFLREYLSQGIVAPGLPTLPV